MSNIFIDIFGPILLIVIILIGFGVMTGGDAGKIVGAFMKMLMSLIPPLIAVFQAAFIAILNLLTYMFNSIAAAISHHAAQQEQNTIPPPTPSTYTPTPGPAPSPSAPGPTTFGGGATTTGAQSGSAPQSQPTPQSWDLPPDIQIIYDKDKAEED